MLPTAIALEPIVMSTLEWKIAEVEYSPPHTLEPGRSRVTTKVPLAFDGLIKQPIREARRADGQLCVAICSLMATGCVPAPFCQVPLRSAWHFSLLMEDSQLVSWSVI